MLKIVPPTWNFNRLGAFHLKVAKSGLTGKDRKELEKESSERFVYEASKILKPASGEEYVHVIALGSLEYYGCNRWGDAFEVDVCKKYHKTFEKHGRWYREHVDHDPKNRSYGVVKFAHFDDKLKRIDLIVALNASKKAMEKNGGAIADKELEKLYSGEVLPVSMACYVSYETCSGCGHVSRTKQQRCDRNICKKYGGCKENIGKTFEDGHTLHVKNPDPIFFDISYVTVPADRIAYSLGLIKDPNIPFTKLADAGLKNVNYKITGQPVSRVDVLDLRLPPNNLWLNLIHKMSNLERHLDDAVYNKYASLLARRENVLLDDEPEAIISSLNRNCCVMPPYVFFSQIYPKIREKEPIYDYCIDTSTCFRDLLKSASRDVDVESNPYLQFSNRYVNSLKENWFKENWSVDPTILTRKTSLGYKKSHFRNVQMVKQPELAKEYALYQLGFILQNTNDEIKSILTVANRIGDR